MFLGIPMLVTTTWTCLSECTLTHHDAAPTWGGFRVDGGNLAPVKILNLLRFLQYGIRFIGWP